jgi:hypothetical protein
MSRFWEQKDFYGVDFSPLAEDARKETFAQPIVGCFDPRMLLAPAISHTIDFMSISIETLKDFTIPIEWKSGFTGTRFFSHHRRHTRNCRMVRPRPSRLHIINLSIR